MGQFKFLLWLAQWYLNSRTFEFDWDKGNLSKSLKKHGVDPIEVESAFLLGLGIPIGGQISPIVDEERFCLIGLTQSGKYISIVFTFRGRRVRPISSRPANKKEKMLYEEVHKTLKRVRED